MATVIQAENLGKLYHLGEQAAGYGTLREVLSAAFRRPGSRNGSRTARQPFWALRDFSLSVSEGDVVGIVGSNGAGKSTLLKLLSRITPPTTGRVWLKGRVGSLLEVGTGFHLELTGRENVQLSGAILGMRRQEIRRRFDEIVEFAELGEFIDTPVKRYSTGMYLRLAFAVAAHLDPEILLVDEVLAVGDARFQAKCLARMNEAAKAGRTVLFVSHNSAALQHLCTRGVLLEKGRLTATGTITEIIERYLQNIQTPSTETSEGTGRAQMRAAVADAAGTTPGMIRPGERAAISGELLVPSPAKKVDIGVGICTEHGVRVMTFHTQFQSSERIDVGSRATFRIEWDNVRLCPGRYVLVGALYSSGQFVASWDNIGTFTVAPVDYYGTGRLPDPAHQGHVLADGEWSLTAS